MGLVNVPFLNMDVVHNIFPTLGLTILAWLVKAQMDSFLLGRELPNRAAWQTHQ